jgi:hypothetical protein
MLFCFAVTANFVDHKIHRNAAQERHSRTVPGRIQVAFAQPK